MATLVAVYVGERCAARCDAGCYDGRTPRENCQCVCCGDNHGVGLQQAVANTKALSTKWKLRWRAEHPDLAAAATFKVYHYRIITQMSFFPDMAVERAVFR